MKIGDREECRDRVVNNEIEKWRQGYKWIENNTEMEHDRGKEKHEKETERAG